MVRGEFNSETNFLPQILKGIKSEEERIANASNKSINQRLDFKEHMSMIDISLKLLFYLTIDHVNRNDDELTIQYLGCRIFNSVVSSYNLFLLGYYQNSFVVMRDLLETGNLIEYFLIDNLKISEWKNSTEKDRKKKFKPVKVRMELDNYFKHTKKKREQIYKIMCEYAAHPTYKGFQLLAPGNRKLVKIGPFYDEEFLKSGFEELSKNFVWITLVYNSHFRHIRDINFLKIQGEFIMRYFEWGQKYIGMKLSKDEYNKIKNVEELFNLLTKNGTGTI